MVLARFIPVFVGIALLSACSRQTTTNTSSGDGYSYNETKSTDPFVFNTKPDEPVPPLPPDTVRDTVIVIVEPPVAPTPPPVPPTPPVAPPQADPFAQPEPWMKPAQGTYMVAKIQRTPCYGTCPTYVGAIFSDGAAFYFGERFVENIGYYQGNISMEQLNGLIRLSYQNNFFDMAPQYPTDGRYIVDLPTTILHINTSINKKTITDKGNAPAELDVLEEAVHTLLHSIQWKPIK